MEMMVKSATQRGDLDAALANRKFIEDWNKDKDNASMGVAFGGSGPAGSGKVEGAALGGKKELKDILNDIITSKWNTPWGDMTFLEGNKLEFRGLWNYTVDTEKMQIIVKNPNLDTYSITTFNGKTMKGKNRDGIEWEITKL